MKQADLAPQSRPGPSSDPSRESGRGAPAPRRGSGAFGYFQVYQPLTELTRAAFLADPAQRTRVFVRFANGAGDAGSANLSRDVRGFAVKFYTEEGDFDLIGHSIPLCFSQDAMTFPALTRSATAGAGRASARASSPHDAFWDAVSLAPENLHLSCWAMSDRAIPRSLRMMEGFGVHTFRLVNAAGKSHLVKFHWRPTIGSQSVLWEEAVKISGADPHFHRRDLWQAIEAGKYPEWELGLQVFDQQFANRFELDLMDATRLIPEEVVPVRPVGKLVLDETPDDFFADTEQVAFHPGHVVPGIDLSQDAPATDAGTGSGSRRRVRSDGPSDHYSQARLFFRSQSDPERLHMVRAFSFELGKVRALGVRRRMLGHLHLIDAELGNAVERALRMEGQAEHIEPARPPRDLDPSPALSLLKKAPQTLRGRKLGVLISDDSDLALLERLKSVVEAEGAQLETIALWVGGVTTSGKLLPVDHALVAAPSVFYDAVALVLSAAAGPLLAKDAAAIDFVRDAFGHLKVIGYTSGAAPLLEVSGIKYQSDEGVISLAVLQSVTTFVEAAKLQRVWSREPAIHML